LNPSEIPFAAHDNEDKFTEQQLRKYLDKVGLSGLLGKAGIPDMMTLYKKLSTDIDREKFGNLPENKIWNSKKVWDTDKVWNSDKVWDTDKQKQHHFKSKTKPKNIKVSAKMLPRPMTFEYDHVTDDETSNRDWSTVNNNINNNRPITAAQSYWSPQRPIQNPIVPVAQSATSFNTPAHKVGGIAPQVVKSVDVTSIQYIPNDKQLKRQGPENLHWQTYFGGAGNGLTKPSSDNFRRNSFPNYPNNYGYLGDSQQAYIDYSQIFPNSVKRKRRDLPTGKDSSVSSMLFGYEDVNKLEKRTIENIDYEKQNTRIKSKLNTSGSTSHALNKTLEDAEVKGTFTRQRKRRDLNGFQDLEDDEMVNILGTAELEEIPVETLKNNQEHRLDRMINVKAHPIEIRSRLHSFKFKEPQMDDSTGQKRKIDDENKFPSFRLPLKNNFTDLHFSVIKSPIDQTSLEQSSGSDNKAQTKAKAAAEGSANFNKNSNIKGHSKVEADVTIHKCDEKGQCKTVNLPDNNKDILHSKQGSEVVKEHESPVSNVDIQNTQPTEAPDYQPTRPLPLPPDSELPEESEIEPENAVTTKRPAIISVVSVEHSDSDGKTKAKASANVTLQNILVKETPSDDTDDTDIKKSGDKPEPVITIVHSHEKKPGAKPGTSVKIHNELTFKPRPLISITVLNKTYTHNDHPLTTTKAPTTTTTLQPKRPAEVEKIEVEAEPTTATSTTTTTPAPPAKQHGLFIYDRKSPGTEEANMFGGDIMLVIDITEELLTHAQNKDESSLQEVEVC